MITTTILLASLLLGQADSAETAHIEGLIKHVGELKDASFVRNGVAYDAATSVKFLRGKWKANSQDIKTAEDFIEKAATKSSTTGKPYLIRFQDGKEVESGKYLRAELAKVKATP